MRDQFPVVVHTLLFRHGSRRTQVLLLRRSRTGYLDGWYALPGGHLKRGESVASCAIRECFEETGILIEATRLRPAVVMPYQSQGLQGIDFIMQCDEVEDEPRLAEPDRFDDFGWWPIGALPAKTVPYIEPAIAMLERGEWFLEFNGP